MKNLIKDFVQHLITDNFLGFLGIVFFLAFLLSLFFAAQSVNIIFKFFLLIVSMLILALQKALNKKK